MSDPEAQKHKIKELQNSESDHVGPWFIIPFEWFNIWKKYVQFSNETNEQNMQLEEPSKLDTTVLLDNCGQLKPDLLENVDYNIVAKSIWEKLLCWYGGSKMVAIKRYGIQVGIKKEWQTEVYLLQIKITKLETLIVLPANSEPLLNHITVEISRMSTVRQLRNSIACAYSHPPACVKLWLETADKDYKVLNQNNDVLEDALQGNLHIYVELKSPFSNEFRQQSEVKKYLVQINSRDKEGSGNDKRRNNYPSGTTGLDNLGNTCFMNSAIQCLSNTEKLTKYFLADRYLSDVNPNNPLGMQGKIAQYYATLLKRIWSGRDHSTSPADFKWILSKFAPQFSGYRQHDAQELLSFLLDGLHEDLNRVIEKPYVENVDVIGKPDNIGASLCWDSHLKRNKSVIVDLFQGQLKSTLNCPSCNNISITFDPFMYLSLPIPKPQDNNHNQNNTSKVWEDKNSLSTLPNTDNIAAYEYKFDIMNALVKITHKSANVAFGIPLIVCVPISITAQQLYNAISIQTNRYTISEKLTNSKFPFTLLYGKNNNNACTKCLTTFCNGCVILCDTSKLVLQHVTSLTADWTSNYECYDSSREENYELHDSVSSDSTKGEGVNLSDCFRAFLEREQLGPQDAWYCPKCQSFQQAFKKFDIWKLPECLVIHFKRFHYDKNSREKLDTFIDYPIKDVDLQNFTMLNSPSRSNAKYSLFAVSIHSGGLGAGHYTAYAQNHIDSQWYLFNDSTVTKIESIKPTKGAYLLLYKRIDSV